MMKPFGPSKIRTRAAPITTHITILTPWKKDTSLTVLVATDTFLPTIDLAVLANKDRPKKIDAANIRRAFLDCFD
jgi:hypothetical protein